MIAGIVLTGGGSQLKHLKQLVEYITGMDTRIGYPNEHLAGDSDSETTSPLFATAVGLVMNSLEQGLYNSEEEEVIEDDGQEHTGDESIDVSPKETIKTPTGPKKSIFDRWAEKFKDFLDNAE